MVVVDASAILELLKGSIQGRHLLALLEAPNYVLGAPHLIDAEVLQTLRRWTLTAGLPVETARLWLDAFQGLANVALAEGLNLPLVTADGRLSRTAGHRVPIHVL